MTGNSEVSALDETPAREKSLFFNLFQKRLRGSLSNTLILKARGQCFGVSRKTWFWKSGIGNDNACGSSIRFVRRNDLLDCYGWNSFARYLGREAKGIECSRALTVGLRLSRVVQAV